MSVIFLIASFEKKKNSMVENIFNMCIFITNKSKHLMSSSCHIDYYVPNNCLRIWFLYTFSCKNKQFISKAQCGKITYSSCIASLILCSCLNCLSLEGKTFQYANTVHVYVLITRKAKQKLNNNYNCLRA